MALAKAEVGDDPDAQRKLIDRSIVQLKREALARLLLLLANFGKEGRPETIIGKFSQEMLAEMIGTTRSRVSNFMNNWASLATVAT
jgi:CRP/FNR family transcriptional regulator, cyclic AMP receptor protein